MRDAFPAAATGAPAQGPAVHPARAPPRGPLRGPPGAPQALTPRQRELLAACVARGYYEIPRRMTLRELAAELGLSATSLSLALRRAEARLVAAHLKGQASAEGTASGAALPAPAVPVPLGDDPAQAGGTVRSWARDGGRSTRSAGVALGGGEHLRLP